MKNVREIQLLLLFTILLVAEPKQASAQVVISEFMAANGTGIRDEDGEHSDWIELYNAGSSPAILDGWFLTDDASRQTKWSFPAGMAPLQPNAYLLIWASGKNRMNPELALHTNFRISKAGGYLALFNEITNVVSSFEPYPSQEADISYGRDRIDPGIVGYFTTPTPNAQNAMTGSGFVAPPVFSYGSGIYTDAVINIAISSSSPVIRFTSDGSLPTTNSLLYTGPILLGTNATIKARAFPPSDSGMFPSEVMARNFLFLDGTTSGFDSGLPLLIISTEGKPMVHDPPPGAPETSGSLTVIDVKNARSSLRQAPDAQLLAGFNYYGFSSETYPKKPIRVETRDALGNDLDVSILGMPPDSDYKLRNPYDDRSLLNDYLATELFEQMGHYSVRRRFVEVFVDTGGGRLNYDSDYYGVMVLFEEIKIAKHRVNLQPVPSTATTEPTISGGYIFNKLQRGYDIEFLTAGGNGFGGEYLALHDPHPNALRTSPATGPLTTAGTNQVRYLVKYLNGMEGALYSNSWLTATGTNHYSSYLDVGSFVDWHWIVEFPKQEDGYAVSTYFYKDRLGKLFAGPIWDYNLAFGNSRNGLDVPPNGWIYESKISSWLRRLISGTTSPATSNGDPDFTQAIADRWAVLRTNLFNPARLISRTEQLALYLNDAAKRDRAHYNLPGTYYDVTGTSIVNRVEQWISARYQWIDSQFVPTPVINAPDGQVANGFPVSISGRTGDQIYYTTNGADPRGPGGTTNGQLYTGPITVRGNVGIVARARGTVGWKDSWSGPRRVILYTAVPALRVTEIMYHPAEPPLGSTNRPSDFEYVEFKNVGLTPLDVNRFTISGGIDFIFPNVTLGPGQAAVVVGDLEAFQSRYGTNVPGVLILGTFDGRLSGGSGHLVLRGGIGEPILDFSYDDKRYQAADGLGFSLVTVDDTAPADRWNSADNWRPSSATGGSPGQPDPTPSARPEIVVNEVLANSGDFGDAIELFNPTAQPVNLGGWFLSDDFGNPKKYPIPPNTMIPAFGYLVFYETNSFNYPTNAPNSFGLGAKGDDVWLFSGDGNDLNGYAHGFSFGATLPGTTLGRHLLSTGQEQFVALRAISLGFSNAGPLIGPIVITEINPHPPAWGIDRFPYSRTNDEYIELQNVTGGSVGLYDEAFPTNTWHLRSAVKYDFPATNVVLSPGAFALVVSFDPAADSMVTASFRARNGVAFDVPLFGPWSGALNNAGDSVELLRPGLPDTNGTTAYILVDRVDYANQFPWPDGWSGTGLSLQKISGIYYGNDPANWVAGFPTPGGATVRMGMPPVIVSQPADQVAATKRDLVLSVTATGSDLKYQWIANGANLPGATNASLTLTNFDAWQAGTYNVLVYNNAGFMRGQEFNLGARLGLEILQRPVDRIATPGATTNMAVLSVGNGPLRYIWKLNGTPVNATNVFGTTSNILTITNIQVFNEGNYTVTVNDDYDARTLSAELKVLFIPLITVHPLSQEVVQGQRVTLTAVATGSTPMSFRWRKQTNTFAFTTLAFSEGPAYSSFTITNFQLSDATNYNVVISNIVGRATLIPGGAQTGASSNAVLSFLTDSDGDGLPDKWEAGRIGFNPLVPADAARDDDGDGMSNLAEYIAGTDYLDPQSYLKINMGPRTAELWFFAVSNHTYSILYSDTPSSGFSQKLVDVPAYRTNRVEHVIDGAPKTDRFYRLVTPIQP